MMSRLRLIGSTCRKIGPASLWRVLAYRIACRSGWYRLVLPARSGASAKPYFTDCATGNPGVPESAARVVLERAEALLAGEFTYFSRHAKKVGAPPDWFSDPFSGGSADAQRHWTRLDEFASSDIKVVWEASRCEWLPIFARALRLSGDRRYLTAMNAWLGDWVRQNPPNIGANWKCGQESSIRCLNLLLTARLLGTHRNSPPGLVALVAEHCFRIAATTGYAIGQDNNHGTSEAAALFVGGAWLAAVADSTKIKKCGARWRETGRRLLENRVATLVGADGSFSQYSVNYHRVLLDTLSQAESWRVELGEPPFTGGYLARCRAAAAWLRCITDPESGDAPNVGANDGARLYDLSSTGYRDFRPSVQLVTALFEGKRAYRDAASDEPLLWLGHAVPDAAAEPLPEAILHGEGGDLVLRAERSLVMVRFANHRFRPGHADCLHLDLWHRGENVLRDGGTYSYNTTAELLDYFSGGQSHNTVQFDGRSQMPRLGRFLFGEWLRMEECSGIRQEPGGLSWCGAYTDWQGARHRRTVRLGAGTLSVVDEISGHHEKALLRWRLMPGEWALDGGVCRSELATVSVNSDAPVCEMRLVVGGESRHYLDKTELPVIEVEFPPGAWTLVTDISLY